MTWSLLWPGLDFMVLPGQPGVVSVLSGSVAALMPLGMDHFVPVGLQPKPQLSSASLTDWDFLTMGTAQEVLAGAELVACVSGPRP